MVRRLHNCRICAEGTYDFSLGGAIPLSCCLLQIAKSHDSFLPTLKTARLMFAHS